MRIAVLGAGGLLGSAVRRAAPAETLAPRIAWGRVEAEAQLRGAVAGVAGPDPWALLWCAGGGVMHSAAGALDGELDAARAVFAAIEALPTASREAGTVVLASSAGGVYAGASPAPFDEHSPTRALSAYGEAKLELEALGLAAAACGVRVGIARIANLYGPGQRLDKGQGLVTALCLAALRTRPLTIYVPLDTVRDYLFVDDAARALQAFAARLAAEAPGATAVKVLASGRAVTISGLLGEFRRLPVPSPAVILAARPASAVQVRDLRLRSRVWTEIDAPTVPLGVGIARTFTDLSQRWRAHPDALAS